jgi:hypothetical protein
MRRNQADAVCGAGDQDGLSVHGCAHGPLPHFYTLPPKRGLPPTGAQRGIMALSKNKLNSFNYVALSYSSKQGKSYVDAS